MKNNDEMRIIGKEICYIVKPRNSNDMFVFSDEEEAYKVAERLAAASGIDYEVLPSYLDPKMP
ncbi:hypothetical protein [Sphingobacterium deserti]|nr:hypothetical protein [Sphingobacterium deserti]